MNNSIQKYVLTDLYEMLNDCSIDRVMAIDEQWRIIAWNKTAAEITGIDKAAIIGNPLLEVFPGLAEDKDMMHAIQGAFEGNKTFLPSRKGFLNRQNYENHFLPLANEDGVIKGVMNIMHDVAHREKAENKLQQLNEALEQQYRQLETATTEMATFTSITSNEIKEPLRHVYTAFELLIRSEGKALSNNGKANIRRIQASLNRINLLLDDIWALSHINSFKKVRDPVDLNAVYQKALSIKLLKKATETQAIIEVDPLPVIPGNMDMLVSLFINIIDNGLKFQLPGNQPCINITSNLVHTEELPTGLRSDTPMQLITFSDNGIGFDAVDAGRIFVMFEKLHPKTEYSGSGMGLAIVKKIMEAHDGFIQVNSQPGKGTIIQCYFPAI